MRLHRFYTKNPIGDERDLVITDEDLIHQWKKVFRYEKGDSVVLFDGSGKEYTYEIDMLSKDEARLLFKSTKIIPQLSKEVWLCVALIKKDNLEWIIEKGTELGVNHFVPIVAERSEKKDIQRERLEKIAQEASEQSGRVAVPHIHPVVPLKDVLKSNLPSRQIVCEPDGIALLASDTQDENPVALFIGPEGGWTDDELDFFKKEGMVVKTLGQQILRAETAAIAAATLFLLR